MKAKEKQISDKVLVAQFKRGSIEAFEEIINRYESKVYNLAMRLTREQQDAEEVLQDVFVTLYKKIESFEGKSAFSSWLYRIVVNTSFMKLRKRRQQPTVFIDDLAPIIRKQYLDHDGGLGLRSDTLSMNRELRTVLQGAINRLPSQYRAVFVLRDVDGLSNQEVSEILDMSVPAVKSRLHRSRLMLRKKLARYWDEYSGRGEITHPIEIEGESYLAGAA